jgi:hypothetical protein
VDSTALSLRSPSLGKALPSQLRLEETSTICGSDFLIFCLPRNQGIVFLSSPCYLKCFPNDLGTDCGFDFYFLGSPGVSLPCVYGGNDKRRHCQTSMNLGVLGCIEERTGIW